MAKRNILRTVLVLILVLLLLAAAAAYAFFPKRAAKTPGFPSMPMDTAGGNLIGNLPENLEAGGFMAGQGGWIYFANFADGSSLYMCRENGMDMVKITDFPVCNINVLGTSLIFTGFERRGDGNGPPPDMFNQENRVSQWLLNSLADGGASFGGKLYAIYGINSSSKPVFCAIDHAATYYSPFLDRDGLYATYKTGNQTVLSNKFYDAMVAVIPEGETLEKKFSSGDKIYAELSGASEDENRIVRFYAKTLMPLDYITGKSLHRVGKGFVFLAADGYAYEITPASGDVAPISSVALNNLKANQFGEIDADTDSGHAALSKEQWYGVIGQAVTTRLESKQITQQNGWYNYFDSYSRNFDSPIYFKANDKYFYIDDSGWSEPWLNTRIDAKPLVSLDDMVDEDAFTPPWIDYSENAEPVDAASADDFGSERTARPDGRADAAENVTDALDAAILILLGDESIADKYTGASVEKLRNRYGGAFETAITAAAGELADTIGARLDIKVSPDEMRDIVIILLGNARYGVGSANTASNGEEAAVALSTTDTLDLDMLHAEFQEALFSQAAEASGYAQMSANEKAAWSTDLLLEIMREPSRYNITNVHIDESQIYMTYSGCWLADNPDALVHSLIYGTK